MYEQITVMLSMFLEGQLNILVF